MDEYLARMLAVTEAEGLGVTKQVARPITTFLLFLNDNNYRNDAGLGHTRAHGRESGAR